MPDISVSFKNIMLNVKGADLLFMEKNTPNQIEAGRPTKVLMFIHAENNVKSQIELDQNISILYMDGVSNEVISLSV
jgi:hypothetical protein